MTAKVNQYTTSAIQITINIPDSDQNQAPLVAQKLRELADQLDQGQNPTEIDYQ